MRVSVDESLIRLTLSKEELAELADLIELGIVHCEEYHEKYPRQWKETLNYLKAISRKKG